MSRDEIIREMGWPQRAGVESDLIDRVERIVRLAMAAEREECARLADEIDDMSGREIAANIRARGKE